MGGKPARRGARVGLVGFMPPPCGSVQIGRGASGGGVLGALQAPATISPAEALTAEEACASRIVNTTSQSTGIGYHHLRAVSARSTQAAVE